MNPEMVKVEVLDGGTAFPNAKTLRIWIMPHSVKYMSFDIITNEHKVHFNDGTWAILNKETWVALRNGQE